MGIWWDGCVRGVETGEGGSVGVEGTMGGTEGHDARDRDASVSGVTRMDMRREGRDGVGVGRGGRGVAIKYVARVDEYGFFTPPSSASTEVESWPLAGPPSGSG